jgi:exopolyphosphatase / guanosine-5'-triphosphate,3'-diphosphate pyrophosphatase
VTQQHEHAARWLEPLDPHTPLPEAAAILLDARFGELRRRMRDLRDDSPEPATIRRTRVAARRAATAVRALEPTLHRDTARRLRRRIKAVRRAAGRVRECDVQESFLSGLLEVAPPQRRAGIEGAVEIVLESLARSRAKHTARLHRLVSREGPRITGDASRLLKSLPASTSAGATSNGVHRHKLSLIEASRAPLARLVCQADTAASADLASPTNLHTLRTASKRLRYAIEVFAGCFSEELRTELYPGLVQIQDRLGATTDLQSLIGRLSGELEQLQPSSKSAGALSELLDRYRAIHDSRVRETTEFLRGGGLGVFRRIERLLAGRIPAGTSGALAFSIPPAAPSSTPPAEPPAEPAAEPRQSQRMAVIDVGTNSIRLEIVDARPDRTYRILDDEKETARLGAGMLRTGELAPEPMERSVQTIARMAAIAAGRGVPPANLRVIGTYAVRAAKNREQFLALVKERTGLEVTVLPPDQEAKLAFLSVSHAFDTLSDVTSAVVDIGGGSTEIVLSAGGVPEQVYGLPLGAMLMTEKFGGPEEATLENFDRLRRHIDRVLEEHVGRPLLIPQAVVGTGGTFGVLASVLNAAGGGPQLWDRRAGFEASRSEIKHLIERLRRTPSADRASVPGIPADRADIIVAGFLIMERVLKHLGANAVRIHDRGIRDGLILSMIARAFPQGAHEADPMAAVRRLALKCGYEHQHSEHVTRLALSLFDQLAARLAPPGCEQAAWATPSSRRLLEAAAVLHDIGYLVSYTAHHKHSYHLIVHSDISAPGLFTARETEIVANIARYHRRAEPSKAHAPFARLPKEDRDLVRALAGILRIADGLDRTHSQRIASVRVEVGTSDARFLVEATGDPDADLWGAADKRSVFERQFGLTCDFRAAAPAQQAATPA